MIAGRIKCDFCGFVGEMEAVSLNKGALTIPDTWVSIHPMIVVHGMRGLKVKTPEHCRREDIKEKVKSKVNTLHCCPACLIDRNVFDMKLSLPSGARSAMEENPMKGATL